MPETLTLAAVPDLVTRSLGIDHPWPVRVDGEEPLVSQRQGGLALSQDGRFKAIWQPSGKLSEVYDLSQWPLEEEGHRDRAPALEAERRAFLERVPAGRIEEREARQGADIEDALRELGYAQ